MELSPVDGPLRNFHGCPPPCVAEAQDALTGTRERTSCGRPTRRGTACGQRQARFTPACTRHATVDETAAAEALAARLTAMVAEWSASLTPACHNWPVTDADRAAVAALPVHPDDERRTAYLGHDLIAGWQQDRCAVCGAKDRDFVLDHDHETALVRGFLCRSCNVTEARSDRGDFEAYRDRPPAVMLGVAARYVSPLYGLVEPEADRRAKYAVGHANPGTTEGYDRSHLDPDQHPAYALMGVLAAARTRQPERTTP